MSLFIGTQALAVPKKGNPRAPEYYSAVEEDGPTAESRFSVPAPQKVAAPVPAKPKVKLQSVQYKGVQSKGASVAAVGSSAPPAAKGPNAPTTHTLTLGNGDELELPPPPRSAAPVAAPREIVPIVTQSTARSSSFDSVPEAQAESIASRLEIVEELIVKYGRAYDYRTHTKKQLETILAELKSAKSSSESEQD